MELNFRPDRVEFHDARAGGDTLRVVGVVDVTYPLRTVLRVASGDVIALDDVGDGLTEVGRASLPDWAPLMAVQMGCGGAGIARFDDFVVRCAP